MARESKISEEVVEVESGTIAFMVSCKPCKITARINAPAERVRRVFEVYSRGIIGVPGSGQSEIQTRFARRVVPGSFAWYMIHNGAGWQSERALGCWGCGGPLPLKRINGFRVPEIVCNARCVSSKGSNCECSCGGENHGGKHTV